LRIRTVLRSAEPLALGGKDGGNRHPRGARFFFLFFTGDVPLMSEPCLAKPQWRNRMPLIFSCYLQDACR
jgi:hypothetical protein